jgi:hypothetical protein
MRKYKQFKACFLILSNRTSFSLIEKYREVYTSTLGMGDTILLYHLSEKKLSDELNKHTTFSDNILTSLNYFPLGFTLVPGSNHFPLLKFYLSHPNYDYYWCIEEDLDFSGDWNSFFDVFKSVDTDFISSHISHHQNEPGWPWWSALAHPYFVIP